jgi:hypothetical protein
MAVIIWDLLFYRTATPEGLHLETDADGNLRDSYLGASANSITGTYDETTNALNFHTGGLGHPGGVLYESFYAGYAILDGDGNTFALAGTYQDHVALPRPGDDDKLGGWYAIFDMN